MQPSKITQALRQEKRERFEQALEARDPGEYRDYMADKNRTTEDRRNEVTGY